MLVKWIGQPRIAERVGPDSSDVRFISVACRTILVWSRGAQPSSRPLGPEWLIEIKHDGFRVIARGAV
jgi:hypothetical protein